jgi:hypothetical protein
MFSGKVKPNSTVRLVLNLINDFNYLSLNIAWAPAHSSCPFNNLADSLAKQLSFSMVPAHVNVSLCQSVAVSLLKSHIWQKWELEWQRNPTASITHEFFPSPLNAFFLRSFFLYHEITQLLTGHSRLNHYLFKINCRSNPNCDCGDPDETTRHYLFKCPRFMVGLTC